MAPHKEKKGCCGKIKDFILSKAYGPFETGIHFQGGKHVRSCMGLFLSMIIWAVVIAYSVYVAVWIFKEWVWVVTKKDADYNLVNWKGDPLITHDAIK